MATIANPPGGALAVGNNSDVDPFVTNSSHGHSQPHRYSSFDSNLFSLYSTNSPSQAKRALQAHLKDTDRRIQDASKLGTTLLKQRKDLSERLKEVEKHQDENEIGPELQAKLAELEKEYNEVGRESAKAFIPNSRASGNDGAGSTAGPSVLSSEAQASPSKVSVPSRKQRNQPSNRVHDIEFATEISTSLLSQVRNLQALLAQRDEELKTCNLERSHLETDAEGFAQRLRALNESEQRYKDENWNLETQLHELIAASKESADKEQRLTQNLVAKRAEHASAQREVDELQQAHGKLSEDHTSFKKQHELEISSLRRNVTSGEAERETLQSKIDELTSQNQELAKAVAYRFQKDEQSGSRDVASENEDDVVDRSTPEYSPPPSPSKGTPRHGILESETLKSSLHHAHRMIQNLKNNIHREKTEKMELKRMLQDARDELETRRSDGSMGSLNNAMKKRKTEPEGVKFKKPFIPGKLGGARNNKDEIILDETGWEDHDPNGTPSKVLRQQVMGSSAGQGVQASGVSAFDRNAMSDSHDTTDAFETANERENTATETEAFQTTVETLNGDISDDLTETEGALRRNETIKAKASPLVTGRVGDRNSYGSTASTSADEVEETLRTPVQAPQQPKYRLKINRGGYRRSIRSSSDMVESNASSTKNSPAASFVSNHSQPAAGQSLFAELGELGADDSDAASTADSTPSRHALDSVGLSPDTQRRSTSTLRSSIEQGDYIVPQKAPMVDSGMMTEPWKPTPALPQASHIVGAALASGVGFGIAKNFKGLKGEEPIHPLPAPPTSSNEEAEDESHKFLLDKNAVSAAGEAPLVAPATGHDSPMVIAARAMSPVVAQNLGPAPPTYGFSEQHKSQVSGIVSQHVEPVTPSRSFINLTPLDFSSATSQRLLPESPMSPRLSEQARTFATPSAMVVKPLAFSALSTVHTVPSEPADEEKEEQRFPPRKSSRRLDNRYNLGIRPPSSVLAPSEDSLMEDTEGRPTDDTRELPGTNAARPGLGFFGSDHDWTPNEQETRTPQMADEATQTLVSSDEIEELLVAKDKRRTSSSIDRPVSTVADLPKGSPVKSGRVSPKRMLEEVLMTEQGPMKTPRKHFSSGSIRKNAAGLPPLPPDHTQKIAAAAQNVSVAATAPSSMGPPVMPASAYKNSQPSRSRTPSNEPSRSQNRRDGTTPRAKPNLGRLEIVSPITRRSSISSFASELDERFNIARNGMLMPEALTEAGTDPRMIQAITQTMIGEYLWKYTRKAGRGEMSENRHKRFFWVHPYTRTLYWSDSDPSRAGRAQMKAKSVAIEAVRVVTDDNPMPPGLHRKSLVVITPGRNIKFTAPTGQRHETWFNALSYLLLRTGPERENEDGNTTSEEVIKEFNPSIGRRLSRMTGRSRTSLSSYHSRTTRTSSPQRNQASMQAPTLTQQRAVDTSQRSYNKTPEPDRQQREMQSNHGSMSGRLSSLSGLFRPPSNVRNSMSSRRGRSSVSGRAPPQDPAIYDAPVVHDSAEDLRQIIAQQEREADRLENVRACCDGKHDGGSLSHKGRHGSMTSRTSHAHTHAPHAHTAEPLSVSSRPRRGE
ncbi:putative nuclear migration protein [Cryomyces antarcticus]